MRLRVVAAVGLVAAGLGSVVVLGGAASAENAPVAPAALCPQLPAAQPAPSVPTRAAGGPIAPPQLAPLAAAAQAAPAALVAAAAAPAARAATAMPYPLPATHGLTGREEAVDALGRVASTGQQVTFSQFAALGGAYRDYYITMRWDWGAYTWDGHLSGIDQAQYTWMGAKPRLVLVTNPRTGKSIIADAMEAGPGPWVTADTHAAPPYWTAPVRGTPAGFTGIVSGFPPAALAALGANTGYAGEHGDDLRYQWAPNQDAVPGQTNATVTGATTTNVSAPVSCTPTTAVQAAYTAPNGITVPIPASRYSQYAGIDWSKYTIKAPNPQVAKGIAAGLGYLGTPYVWGGGGAHGPDNGCGRGGGQSNSCQGTIGFDCSGLTAYMLGVAGHDIPGDSSAQRSAGQSIPWTQALPGDIIGYPGHVAIYLGVVNGQQLQLEAPDVGQNIRVTTIFRSDRDPAVHRYWGTVHV